MVGYLKRLVVGVFKRLLQHIKLPSLYFFKNGTVHSPCKNSKALSHSLSGNRIRLSHYVHSNLFGIGLLLLQIPGVNTGKSINIFKISRITRYDS